MQFFINVWRWMRGLFSESVKEKNVWEPKSVSFTLPDRRTVHVKPKRIWKRRHNTKWRLPVNTKVGDFVIFPFGIARHTTRSGTVKEIRGNQAKILMMCKAGSHIAYRKITTGV